MKRSFFLFILSVGFAGILSAANVRVQRMDGGSSSGSAAVSGSGSVSIQPSGGGGYRFGAGSVYHPSYRSSSSSFNDPPAAVHVRRQWNGGDSSFRGSAAPAVSGRARIVRQSNISVPSQHAVVARSPGIVRNIGVRQRVEVVPNRYYWHNFDGRRYVHFYDGRLHWWGFYAGSHFYWTRYWDNCWWWYDPWFNHWVFWADGYWWWSGPSGLYIAVNNVYYPYDQAPVSVERPDVPAQAPQTEETEPKNTAGGEWTSPDGTRSVQIIGDRSEAFLYDRSSGQPVFLSYLGKNVERVRFSGGTEGKPLQILVEFKDGTFSIVSANGNPIDRPDSAAPSQKDTLPPEPPPPPQP